MGDRVHVMRLGPVMIVGETRNAEDGEKRWHVRTAEGEEWKVRESEILAPGQTSHRLPDTHTHTRHIDI